jgi:hypothetical protein
LRKAKESFEILRNSSENGKLVKVQFIRGVIYSDLGDLKRWELELRDAFGYFRASGEAPEATRNILLTPALGWVSH